MQPRAGLSWLSIFTSSSTLVCCALPALLVALGAGAALSSLVGAFPQIVWLSEHKVALFITAGAMLALVAALDCPADPQLAEACATAKDTSLIVYWVSLAIYTTGAFFAFVAPLFM